MIEKEENLGMDLRDKENPIHVCPCGSRVWNIQAMFEDYEISMYFTEMECALCGTLATAPTPIDNPTYIWKE